MDVFRLDERRKSSAAPRVIKPNSSLFKRVSLKTIPPPFLSALALALAILFCLSAACATALAAEPVATSAGVAGMAANAAHGYNVRAYVVQGKPLLTSNLVASILSKYTGTNVGLKEILHAASDLETEYRHEGYRLMDIVIAPRRITNGIVTLNAFPGAVPQIVVAGKRYLVSSNGLELAEQAPPAGPEVNTNRFPPFPQLGRPATSEEMARAYAALAREMGDITAHERDTHIRVVATNAGPRFTVYNYQIAGNTILPPGTISMILTNIDGAFGTNVSLDGIRAAAAQLQSAYRARGFVTVAVTLPPQKLTNATVKIQVTEGRLAAIEVKGNHFFSAQNVMRALPSLHTNMILNSQVFQQELNRANADQDRQIYPVVEPGPDPGTTELTLIVQDRLPVHAKLDLDNQYSPGTPVLRVNSSAVADNLWQEENSLGIQYGFSPEEYKDGKQWNFYDQPLVANYSAYYRLPLGNPAAIEDVIASSPGSFGYDEATRKFNLPPASGQPELNIYASRSTIDTGLANLSSTTLYSTNGNSLVENIVQQDLTVNNDLGFCLSAPLPATADFHSGLSGGLDFKTFELTSAKTNVFVLNGTEIDYVGNFSNSVVSTFNSPVPFTVNHLEYLPLSLHYDGGWKDALGLASFGLGASGNAWFYGDTTISSSSVVDLTRTNSSGVITTNSSTRPKITSYHGVQSLQQITGSKESSGHWVVLNPSFSHTFQFVTNWVTTVRADGQWASEPLISNEQFGAGGVNSVRGYHEGEVFGDTGWHISLEQQTPTYVVGTVYGHTPLTVSGTVYMDFARTYLLDPQGRAASTSLCGVGVGGVASIGSHWQARLLMSVPLLSTVNIPAFEPYFNFMLTGQF